TDPFQPPALGLLKSICPALGDGRCRAKCRLPHRHSTAGALPATLCQINACLILPPNIQQQHLPSGTGAVPAFVRGPDQTPCLRASSTGFAASAEGPPRRKVVVSDFMHTYTEDDLPSIVRYALETTRATAVCLFHRT